MRTPLIAGLAAIILVSLLASGVIIGNKLLDRVSVESAATSAPPTITVTPVQTMIPQTTWPIQIIDNKILFADRNEYLGRWSPTGRSFLWTKLSGNYTQSTIDTKSGIPYKSNIPELWLYSLDTNRQTMLTNAGMNGTWSPDGQEVRYYLPLSTPKTVEARAIHIATGNITSIGTSNASTIRYAANGAMIFVRNKQIIVRPANGREFAWPNATLDDPDSGFFELAPDGSALLLSQNDKLLLISQGGTVTEVVTDFKTNGTDFIRWSPDSKEFIYINSVYPLTIPPHVQLRVYNITTKKLSVLATATDPKEMFLSPDWTPDGQTITFARQIQGSGIPASLWAIRSDGSGLTKVGDNIHTAFWSPDGKHLAYEDASPEHRIGIITVK